MRLLTILFGAVVVPLLALAGLGFFLPSQWYAERALMLDAAPGAVQPYVGDLHRWAEFVPWDWKTAQFSPGNEVSFKGEDGREGKLKLLSADPQKGAEFELTGGGWGRESRGFLVVAAIGKRTRVSMGATGKLHTYLGRYAQPLIEMNVGNDLEAALLALRNRLHAPPSGAPAGPPVVASAPSTDAVRPAAIVMEPARVPDEKVAAPSQAQPVLDEQEAQGAKAGAPEPKGAQAAPQEPAEEKASAPEEKASSVETSEPSDARKGAEPTEEPAAEKQAEESPSP